MHDFTGSSAPRKKRKIDYQMRTVSAPCCTVCDEVLMGIGTVARPYNCSCGTWENTEQDPFNYTVWTGEELNERKK